MDAISLPPSEVVSYAESLSSVEKSTPSSERGVTSINTWAGRIGPGFCLQASVVFNARKSPLPRRYDTNAMHMRVFSLVTTTYRGGRCNNGRLNHARQAKLVYDVLRTFENGGGGVSRWSVLTSLHSYNRAHTYITYVGKSNVDICRT